MPHPFLADLMSRPTGETTARAGSPLPAAGAEEIEAFLALMTAGGAAAAGARGAWPQAADGATAGPVGADSGPKAKDPLAAILASLLPETPGEEGASALPDWLRAALLEGSPASGGEAESAVPAGMAIAGSPDAGLPVEGGETGGPVGHMAAPAPAAGSATVAISGRVPEGAGLSTTETQAIPGSGAPVPGTMGAAGTGIAGRPNAEAREGAASAGATPYDGVPDDILSDGAESDAAQEAGSGNRVLAGGGAAETVGTEAARAGMVPFEAGARADTAAASARRATTEGASVGRSASAAAPLADPAGDRSAGPLSGGPAQGGVAFPPPWATARSERHATAPMPEGMNRAGGGAAPAAPPAVPPVAPTAEMFATLPADATSPTADAGADAVDPAGAGDASPAAETARAPEPPRAAPPAAPVALPQLRNAMAERVRAMAEQAGHDTVRLRNGAGTSEVELAPAHLGRLRLQLSTTERGLHLTVLVDRPESVDAVRRHLDGLHRSLMAEGVTLDGFDIDTGGGARGQDQAAGQGRARRDAPAAPPRMPPDAAADARDTPTPPSGRPAAGRLDIRL